MSGLALDVLGWMRETKRVAPVTLDTLRQLERLDLVVDLQSGEVFEQAEDWFDFAQRWAEHRRHCGKALDVEELAAAMHRASRGLAWRVIEEMAALFFNRIAANDQGIDGLERLCYADLATSKTPNPL